MKEIRNPLNTKIYFELLPDSEQPQKTFMNSELDKIKLCKVLKTGNKVSNFVKEEDIITVPVHAITMMYKETKGFCSERDVIFSNSYPVEGKVHIKNQERIELNNLNKAIVIKSSSQDIDDEDEIFYKNGQSLVLPDHTEIISESQIYFK